MRRVALCLGGLLNSLVDVAPSIRRFLVEPIDADTFVSGPAKDVEKWSPALAVFGPYLAQVRFERENVSHFIWAAGNTHTNGHDGWLRAAKIRGNWLGCLEGAADAEDEALGGTSSGARAGSGLCQMYSHQQCMSMVADWEQKRGALYERIVYSRPDFQWIGPHVPMQFLPDAEFWVMDGEDNGGTNDRHWVLPRQLAPMVLNSWERLLSGQLADMFGKFVNGVSPGPRLPWLSTEIYFMYLFIATGMSKLIRRFPISAFVLCAKHHDRKLVDTTASGLNDSRRLGHVAIRCPLRGPKYKREYENAKIFADCTGEGPVWSWEILWRCWCKDRDDADMLSYTEYRLCVRAKMVAGPWQGMQVTMDDEYVHEL